MPERPTLARLRAAAARCTACDLYKTGTQTVFGEGERTARAIFLGEQPGDSEDKAGRPFVGPAGKLLDRALEACWSLGATASQALLGKSFRVLTKIAPLLEREEGLELH